MSSIVESHGLLSPTPSTSSTPSGSRNMRGLPIQRSKPLRPGGKKEISLINYVDDKILRINRRYGKKFIGTKDNVRDDTPGYTDFDQVIEDIEAVFEVVWVSGTPTLQIPYLLSLAGLLCSYMPAFSFSTSTFHLARRFDLAFVSLLRAPKDACSSNTQSSSYQVSATEKARIKSLVEDTRVVAVETAAHSGHSAQIRELSSSGEADSEDLPGDDNAAQYRPDDISMGISKIYRHILEILGDALI